jgi:hypothetical protein
VKSCSGDSECDSGFVCSGGKCVGSSINSVVVSAKNGFLKNLYSPYSQSYDFVVACDKQDYVFNYTSISPIKMNYYIDFQNNAGFSQAIPFGGSDAPYSLTGEDSIDILCNNDLNRNTVSHRLVTLKFVPVIDGKEGNLKITKMVMVLARGLTLNVTRCTSMTIDPQCNFVGSSTNAFVMNQNNTDYRAISCTGSNDIGGGKDAKYLINIYPKVSDNGFPPVNYARVLKWSDTKYYRCEDQYGYVIKGSFLSNPVEWLFSLTFTPSVQLFIILLILLGVPTLVLAGSRGK